MSMSSVGAGGVSLTPVSSGANKTAAVSEAPVKVEQALASLGSSFNSTASGTPSTLNLFDFEPDTSGQGAVQDDQYAGLKGPKCTKG